MKEQKLESKENIPSESELVHFSWGGTTPEWEEEADQIMHYKQDKLDKDEPDAEKEKKIEYANQKQYW